MSDEYYQINTPSNATPEIYSIILQLSDILLQISERLNDLEDRIETLEAA
jgi:hypothetical protein